jgi:glycosyltransferase involved in cell wall biosynthesis
MTQPITMFLLKPGMEAEQMPLAIAPGATVSGPLISCLMVTRGALEPARFAIQCYRQQSYANRELVILCDRPASAIADHVAALGDPSIRYVEMAPATLGELRNGSVAHARGALLCQWDDDDLYHPQRLALQAAALKTADAEASFLARWQIWWPARRRLAVSSRRIWEGSMLVKRGALPIYPAQRIGEDREVVALMRARQRLVLVDQPLAYCYIVHGANSCGEAHFERLFANASHDGGDPLYEGELARLQAAMPIDDYAEALGLPR